MNNAKKFFSKIGFNYLILSIISIIAQIVLINSLWMIDPTYINDINSLSIIVSLCNYIIAFPLFYWLMKKLEKFQIEKRKINAKTFILYLGITITLMWIGNIIGLIITSIIGGVMQSDIANPVQELINNADMWFNLLVISIIAPIFEEIFFRKILIDRTINYGIKVSVILSATIFALFHGNINQFFYAFLLGGFLAYVYIKTGNVVYPIILHLIVNLMGSVVSLVVNNSINNLLMAFSPIDFGIIIIYIAILLSFILIGITGLIKFRKKYFIKLEIPYKTVFINFGMICFIGFFVFEMIYQILG